MKEKLTIAEAMTILFNSDNFNYVSGGSLSGETFLRVASILNGTIKGDFMLFDNAGGKAFDTVVNFDDHNRVEEFLNALKELHPSWILAYRVGNKETITETLERKLKSCMITTS